MQAVIRTGGKQYLVQPGQTLEVDRLNGDAKKFEPEVLLVIDGNKITVGTPLITDIKVVAEVVEEVKGDKIKVLKFKAKKREKTLTGHRQKYTLIKIVSIGSAQTAAKGEKKPAVKTRKPATATV